MFSYDHCCHFPNLDKKIVSTNPTLPSLFPALRNLAEHRGVGGCCQNRWQGEDAHHVGPDGVRGRQQAAAPPHLQGPAHAERKPPAANSIEREFKNYKDKKGCPYPRGVAYAVDPKGWHSQRVFDDV